MCEGIRAGFAVASADGSAERRGAGKSRAFNGNGRGRARVARFRYVGFEYFGFARADRFIGIGLIGFGDVVRDVEIDCDGRCAIGRVGDDSGRF